MITYIPDSIAFSKLATPQHNPIDAAQKKIPDPKTNKNRTENYIKSCVGPGSSEVKKKQNAKNLASFAEESMFGFVLHPAPALINHPTLNGFPGLVVA